MKKLITLLLLAGSQLAPAQSWTIVNTNDLETDGSTNNVHIVNNLGIGISPNATDNLSVSKNILMDVPNDNDFNNIHTTSTLYGLRLCSGSDDASSSSIKLYATSHATLDGMLRFTSYQNTSSTNSIGFKFSNYLIPSNNVPTLVDLVAITKSGWMGIGTNVPNEKLEIMNGNLSINSTGDAAIRKIVGYTTTKGLQIMANTAQSNGPAIAMIGGSAGTDPGCMALSNYGASSRFGFYKYDPTYPASPMLEQIEIQNNGNISMLKRTDAEYRQIEAHTLLGRLSMHSNYASNNGSTIELWGNNNEYAGEIHFIDYGPSNFVFQQYKPSAGVFDPQIQINADGNILMPRLITEDAQMRIIGATSHGGGLALRSEFNGNDGSGLELYGDSHTTYPGQMHLIDYGTGGEFDFMNYTPTHSFTTQIRIDNAGDINMYKPLDDATWRKVVAKTTTGVMNVGTEDNSGNGSRIEMYATGVTDATRKGAIHFVDDEAGNSSGTGFEFLNHTPSTYVSLVRIQKNGKVAIGNTNMDISSSSYNLFVEKGIMTERVRVAIKNSGDWSDYVFGKDYKLMPISDVIKYTTENKHLPEMPSADEVVKNGIDVGEMNAKLLQKIEELTLYVGQQQKEIEDLKRQIKNN